MAQDNERERVTGAHPSEPGPETPGGLLARPDLDRAAKVAALRQWEQELRERQVAESESMLASAPPAFTLEEVLGALHVLGEAPQEHPVPTTHG